jgi:hypothetical protein
MSENSELFLENRLPKHQRVSFISKEKAMKGKASHYFHVFKIQTYHQALHQTIQKPAKINLENSTLCLYLGVNKHNRLRNQQI